MTTPLTPTRVDSDTPAQGDSAPESSRGLGRIRGLLRFGRRRKGPDRWLAREQRRRRIRALTIVLIIGVVAAGIWAFAFSSLLSVRKVEVQGLTELGNAVGSGQVTSAAAIEVGTPIARVDAGEAAARIGGLAWVDSVEVRRAWPDAIVIAVTERTPVAVVESSPVVATDVDADIDGASDGDVAVEPLRQGVDADGIVFTPPGGLWLDGPIIRGEPEAIPEAVAVVAALPEDIATRVRAVQAVSPDDIRLQLGNDAIVRWGNASEPEFKAEVLAALMTRRARGYDVSAPELPTTFNERGPKK